LINLLLLLLLASLNSTLQTSWLNIFSLALFAILVESFISYRFEKRLYFPFSAIITAFGIVLMIGWSRWYIPYILILVAILQKKFLKLENRHIFNPSNFAVIFALLFFYPKALPLVGQLGDEGYILSLVVAIGILILVRVDRILITLSFIFSYIFLEYLIIGNSDPHFNLDYFLTKFYSISFVVYLFFMLTDPVTTPSNRWLQIAFGALTALIVVLLDYFSGMHLRNIFLALFLTSIIFVPFYRHKFNKYLYIFLLFLSIFATFYILSQKPIYFSM